MDRGLLLLLTLTTTVGVKGEDGGAETPLWPDVVPAVPAGADGEEALEIATAAGLVGTEAQYDTIHDTVSQLETEALKREVRKGTTTLAKQTTLGHAALTAIPFLGEGALIAARRPAWPSARNVSVTRVDELGLTDALLPDNPGLYIKIAMESSGADGSVMTQSTEQLETEPWRFTSMSTLQHLKRECVNACPSMCWE